MQRRSAAPPDRHPDALVLAAGTWLACGLVLLALTPLPLHVATWGWTPAFWLVPAPALLLAVRRWLTPALRIDVATPARCLQGRNTRHRDRSASASTLRRERGTHVRRASRPARRAG